MQAERLRYKEPMGQILTYAGLRGLGALATMLVGTLAVFLVMKAAPGDPALIALGDFANPQAIAAFNAEKGLDQPVFAQYLAWLTRALQFDFGESLTVAGGQRIGDLLLFRLPNTFFIGALAILIALAIALAVGISAAVWRGTAIDTTATSAAVFGISMPDFWLAYILILTFSIGLGWFPSYGFMSPSDSLLGAVQSGFLPALAIAAPMAAVFARTLRTALLENISKDYVTAARSFGFKPRFVFIHYILRNSLIPFIVIVGLQVRYLLGGVVVIERIFGINGVGSLMIDAAFSRDYFVVQACTVVFLAIVLAVNFIVDVVCALLDPKRTR